MSIVKSSKPRDEARLRVVADTKIYGPALQFGGVAEDFWLLARAILQEALNEITAHAHVVRPGEMLAVIHDDPSDDQTLECAVEAEAHMAVSGDSHLRRLKTFRAMQVF